MDRALPIANGATLGGAVLVAEDNPINRMVIASLLGQLGMTVTIVNDGQQVVDYIVNASPANRPDLVLMDLHMPLQDGYTATQQIRQWEQANNKPRLTIIALTADAYDEDRQRCLAAGMNDFLTKPIAMDALRQALTRWLPSSPPKTMAGAMPALPLAPPLRQQFLALATEIMPLLQNSKFNALAKIEELQNLVRATPLESEVADIADILKTFRFDLALIRLHSIVATLVA